MDFSRLERDLSNQFVHPKLLLGKFRMLDEDSRFAPAYQDPLYLPFYYHLGKYIRPKIVVDIGFGLGLNSGCLLKSCPSIEKVVAYQEVQGFYSPRLAIKNLKDISDIEIGVYLDGEGEISPEFLTEVNSYKVDLILVNEKLSYDKFRNILTACWNSLKDDGLVVVDYLSLPVMKQAFLDFAKIENREPVFFESRYRTGILKK